MSSFTPRLLSPAAAEPDPTKHVNYSLGMVLGVDDFTQEFAYLSGRDQWLARDLLGYGTVSGLSVRLEIESGGPQVSITPGVALSPRGRLIRVAPGQCASINGWLAAHHDELLALLGSPMDDRASLRLFVVLGYRECPSDMIPIPGQPCRSEDETTAPSRITDDFKLELRLEAPDQQEEDALRDFVAWLSQVEITDSEDSMTTVAEFEDAIRGAAYLDASPPASSPPDFMYGSPPAGLRIHTSMTYEYLRAAFRVWVTELRPRWQPRFVGKGLGCSGSGASASASANGDSPDDCLLLAELTVRMVRVGAGGDWQVEDAEGVVINEERRPYLLHLRMVQEWLLGERRLTVNEEGAQVQALPIAPGFTVTPQTNYGQTYNAGNSLDYSRADHTHGTPASPTLAGDVEGDVSKTFIARIQNVEVKAEKPADRQVLTFVDSEKSWMPFDPAQPSSSVVPETAFGQTAAVGTSSSYARADHTHGTPPAPPPPVLAGDAMGPAGDTVVAKIRGVVVHHERPTDGQVLAYNGPLSRWMGTTLPAAAPTPTLAGDVTGPVGSNKVEKLQGVDVSSTPPNVNGQVLTYDLSLKRWGAATPAAVPAPGNSVANERTYGLAAAVGSATAYSRADHTHGTPPLPAVGGDATGIVNNISVTGLRGKQIDATPPLHGQVLTFEGDGTAGVWRAANPASATTGDFVRHPAGQPAYSIVAAGIVRGDDADTASPDRYNGLRIRRVENGRIVVTFDGYVHPASKGIQYIVKALPVSPTVEEKGALVPIFVNFETFFAGDGLGFTLLVMNVQGPVGGEQLRTMSFMIEVSQYDMSFHRGLEKADTDGVTVLPKE